MYTAYFLECQKYKNKSNDMKYKPWLPNILCYHPKILSMLYLDRNYNEFIFVTNIQSDMFILISNFAYSRNIWEMSLKYSIN